MSPVRPTHRTLITAGTLCSAVLLMVACASGPKYGAAKRKKKSCDCPHWNHLPTIGPGTKAHAGMPALPCSTPCA